MATGSGSSPTLTLAVCQFAPTADREQNRDRIAEMVADAAARGAELVVFPEYSSYFVPEMDVTLAANAESFSGPFAAHLQGLAAQYDIAVVAGMIEAGIGMRVRNTVVAVDADDIRAVYRKQHLYDAFGDKESTWVEPGELGPPETFTFRGFTIGLMTCYDLRFPEVARTLVDAGAEVILVPADWIRGPLKEHNWQTLLMARAMENTAYIAAADHPVPTGIGHSMIVDPHGVVRASAGVTEGIAVARIELGQIESAREINPALRLRRYRVVPR